MAGCCVYRKARQPAHPRHLAYSKTSEMALVTPDFVE